MIQLPEPSDEKRRKLEAYVVAAAQLGDRAAMTLLVRQWHRRFTAHAWRLTGSQDIAEEVAQASWIEILRGLAKLRDERAFPAWAYRIVTRHSARRVRQSMADRSAIQMLTAEPPCPINVSDSVSGLDTAKLHRAMVALSPAHRATLALHYFEELSVAEVAVALETPSGTIKTRLMHARRQLRAQFEGDEDA